MHRLISLSRVRCLPSTFSLVSFRSVSLGYRQPRPSFFTHLSPSSHPSSLESTTPLLSTDSLLFSRTRHLPPSRGFRLFRILPFENFLPAAHVRSYSAALPRITYRLLLFLSLSPHGQQSQQEYCRYRHQYETPLLPSPLSSRRRERIEEQELYAAAPPHSSRSMNERFRERLGHLSEELDGSLRSVSPLSSRSGRRNSRSPRPHKTVEPTTSSILHDSRPNIAAWPAPPANPILDRQHAPHQHLQVNTVQPVQQSSSPALSPNPSVSGRPGAYDDVSDSAAFLSMIRASVNESRGQGREVELKRKIQTLEDTVAEYERQKYNVMGTFTEYRERVAEREKKLEAEYSTKIISLSEEVLAAKKDFEQRMKHFQSLQERFEREKEQALEKLRQEHQKEIELLEKRFSESQLLNLENKYLLEIQRLEEERKSLRQEKDRLGETFEMKLRRAQSLYETELAAAKMLYSRELEALRDHEEALKEELLARQEDFHDRIQELQHQAKRSRDELSSCKNEVSALEKKLFSKEAEVQHISQELEEARNETNDALRRLNAMESQLEQTTTKYQEQEEDLRRKCDLLDVVEATKIKLEAVIKTLQSEVKTLKQKMDFLEKERKNLQSQSESQTQLQNSQVHALEAVLESVKGEREATKEHYENLLTKEREQADARELSMKKEFTIKLNELEEQYNSLKEDLQHTARLDKDELRESTEQEIEALRTEKSALEAQVNALKAQYLDGNEEPEEMESRLAEILKQTESLSDCLQTQRDRLASKDEEISRLRRRVEEENQVTEDQLIALREEVKMEMMAAGGNGETEELHARIAELEMQCEKDEQELEEEAEKIRSLESENTRLKEELSGRANDDSEKLVKEALAEQESTLRDEFSKRVEEAVAAEKDKAEREMKAQSVTMVKQFEQEKAELTSELSTLRDASGISDQKLIELQAQCESLMDEMEGIKGQLAKKTEQIDHLTKSGDGQRSDEAKRVLVLEDELLQEKKSHVEEVEGLRKEKESFADRISQLQAELEQKQRELAEQSEEKEQSCSVETTSIDVQTDEMEKPAPVAIVDLAKEKELRIRIIELESTLEQKEALIIELHERIDTVIMDDMPKKKDRSASVGGEHSISGGLKCQKTKLQNFVSSMTSDKKEKREAEAQAAAKKKEEKAEKAAAHAIKEKSPSIQRSKSPSLLTRLRERSPGKAKMQQQQSSSMDNAGALSSSSRNLLSPSDADMERRSPSRALFSRTKKESSIQPPTPATTAANEKSRPAWKI